MAIEQNSAHSIAVFALTVGGTALAKKLDAKLADVHLYIPKRLEDNTFSPSTVFFSNWQQTVVEAFKQYRKLIFIMATGIVVRTLAPLLDSKKNDPAVVVLDEKGKFAISLISGHLGGANQLATNVAKLMGGTAVITTATDVNGVPALDLLAKELGCNIYPASGVKIFNRLMVEGERVALCSPWVTNEISFGFAYSSNNPPETGPVVYITNMLVEPRIQPKLILRPRNLVVGVGCRKGVSPQQVIAAIKTTFKLGGYSLLSIKCISTVDLKMEETGLQEAAKYFRVPLVEITREQIQDLEGLFLISDFVKDTIGVGGVCEPTAMIASGMGQLKVSKQKIGPVTVAIAEARLWWWD